MQLQKYGFYFEISSFGSFFLCETETSSHGKATKNQNETKRNRDHYTIQFRQKESNGYHN